MKTKSEPTIAIMLCPSCRQLNWGSGWIKLPDLLLEPILRDYTLLSKRCEDCEGEKLFEPLVAACARLQEVRNNPENWTHHEISRALFGLRDELDAVTRTVRLRPRNMEAALSNWRNSLRRTNNPQIQFLNNGDFVNLLDELDRVFVEVPELVPVSYSVLKQELQRMIRAFKRYGSHDNADCRKGGGCVCGFDNEYQHAQTIEKEVK